MLFRSRKVGCLLDVHAATLASKDKLAIHNVLEHIRGGLELVEVVVHEGAVALALAQHTLRVGGVPLVLHNADGHGAMVQQDEPYTACLICMQHMRSAWWHACTVWVACTLQHLNPDGIFTACARLIALTARPVAPAHNVTDIVEVLVELAVLEVTLGHEARTAGGINEVVEVDHAGGSGGARGLVLVRSGNGVAGGVVVCKVEGGVLGVLEDGDPGHVSMAEELIKLKAHDVPHTMGFKEGVKVGVALMLVLGELECSAGLHPGGEGGGAS